MSITAGHAVGGRRRIWFFEVTPNERATWAACFGGRVLDAMDSQLYALILPTLMVVFALNRAQAGLLGSLTTFVAAFSTLFAGAAIDRFGRLRVLQGALLISAVTTCLTAVAHSFIYLAIVRSVQGIGYAAELTAALTLVSEVMTPKFRASAISAMQSGYAVGYAIALGSMVTAYAWLPEHIAWRVLCVIGIIPAIYVIILQRFIAESPLFVAERKVVPVEQDKSSYLDLFRKGNGRNTLITAMISIGVFGAAQIMIFWLPTYLRSAFHLNVTKTAGYMVLNILGSFIGNLMYGPIADRYGRRPVFIACLAVQSVSVGAYVGFTSNLVLTLVLGFVVGLLQGGLSNGVQPIIAELFGTRIRGRAFGINNAIVRGAAAATVGLVGFLATHFSFGLSIGLVAICLYAVAVCGVLLVRETKGIELPTEIVPIAGRTRP